MNNYFFEIPVALTAILPTGPALTVPVKMQQKHFESEVVSIDFVKYYKPVKISKSHDAINKLNTFPSLGENWDGYNGTAPDFSVIKNSLSFLTAIPESVMNELKEDNVTATPYGTVVIDFNHNEEAISVEIGENKIGFFTEFKDGTDEILDGKLFNQHYLPRELLQAFAKLYKENSVSANSSQD
jgi:hypothetical protein